jgi:hypothetical protein
MKTETTDTKPDYQVAAEKLAELFDSLKLPVEISSPVGVYDNDWACISYLVKIGSQSFEYSLGIGHVDWNAASRLPSWKLPSHKGYNTDSVIMKQAQGVTWKKEFMPQIAELAAWIAKAQKVQPKAAEVLASCCREGRYAEQSAFNDWADDFGYDIDSRKAERTYQACRENGAKARQIVSSAVFDQMAELSSQL